MSIQLTLDDIQIHPGFDGGTYDRDLDHARLTGLLERVFILMSDGKWRTLHEIVNQLPIHSTEASVSARLRDLRKQKFGRHTVNRRRRGEASRGLFEYSLMVNQ